MTASKLSPAWVWSTCPATVMVLPPAIIPGSARLASVSACSGGTTGPGGAAERKRLAIAVIAWPARIL